MSWVALGPFTGIGCWYHSDFETVWSHYTGESTTQVNLSCCNATSLVRVVHARDLSVTTLCAQTSEKITAYSASCQDHVELRLLSCLSWACGKGLWGPVPYLDYYRQGTLLICGASTTGIHSTISGKAWMHLVEKSCTSC